MTFTVDITIDTASMAGKGVRKRFCKAFGRALARLAARVPEARVDWRVASE